MGQQAATWCLQQGWIECVATQRVGKRSVEFYGLTPAGVQWFLHRTDARAALETLQQRLEQFHRQWQNWADTLRTIPDQLAEWRQYLERLATHLTAAEPNGCIEDAWHQTVLHGLRHWHETHPHEDCPLPELFRQVQQGHPRLTIGQFHDGLRRLYGEGRIFLHPWAGPIYEIPEPEFAMLVGHALVYYASARVM
jgi:hypothetical protein